MQDFLSYVPQEESRGVNTKSSESFAGTLIDPMDRIMPWLTEADQAAIRAANKAIRIKRARQAKASGLRTRVTDENDSEASVALKPHEEQ